MAKRNTIELFESRKGHLDYRLKRDYVRNGIAAIPCRVSDYSDVISAYSVKGCETLNPDFDEYLKSTAELMPPECPLCSASAPFGRQAICFSYYFPSRILGMLPGTEMNNTPCQTVRGTFLGKLLQICRNYGILLR